jgi:hypothetical protein
MSSINQKNKKYSNLFLFQERCGSSRWIQVLWQGKRPKDRPQSNQHDSYSWIDVSKFQLQNHTTPVNDLFPNRKSPIKAIDIEQYLSSYMRKFQFFVNCQHKKKEMKPVVIHEP